ncbi:HD domain-containing protein [Mariprofundus erugo]|uniref:HD domain-containing protein n=1 Tax=Mariprofundus erugo TaxID=2528639 RepID=A0A5R9GW72_9PROT|nr:HD domain-containing phosphohydrolase [Mariprofundus erugo]TLS68192.1 HD domain-containing protein [Mariprofundus erugo]
MSTFDINLHELVYSLSDALDLVGVVQVHHGKRVAFMAAECGKQLGFSADELDGLFQAAILHDCGVSNTAVHARLAQFEWEQSQGHCDIGAALLRQTPPLAHLADVIQYHHTHWHQLREIELPAQTRRMANLIFLVDRVDVLSLKAQVNDANILLGVDAILEKIISKRGDWFDPELVDALIYIADSEAFWLSLEREHVDGYVSEWMQHEVARPISFEHVKSLVRIFSHIVDAKSPFTRDHSEGVARLARYLGGKLGLPEHSCDMLELAGLLHDIGKLRVPDEILEKPGRLNTVEFKTIQRHSFDTFSILKKVKGFDAIARWAGQHHERVDGGGYPYHTKKSLLSLEARIIAVADVFQALAQNRPYRQALSAAQVLALLQENVDAGKLDRHVVELVEAELDTCWREATCMERAL